MCRRSSLHLMPQPAAAGEARRFVARQLHRWELDELGEEAQLLASELVTNAVLHARTPVTVTVDVADGSLEISVSDASPRPPVSRSHRDNLLADLDALTQRGGPQEADDDDRHPVHHIGSAGSVFAGRGLILVEALSDEWGVAERVGGKDVWFRLLVPTGWAYQPDCPCTDQEPVLRTASGAPLTVPPGPWTEPVEGGPEGGETDHRVGGQVGLGRLSSG